jgi:SAM-dependent methyltransferase
MTHDPGLASDLRASILERFGRIARTPQEERRFPVGPESARQLGYRDSDVEALPSTLTESFCGVGNPLALSEPVPGRNVLDLGCGAGVDTVLAARKVGACGRANGVDRTPAMLAKAHRCTRELRTSNARFVQGETAAIPLADESFDLVISNGVFNLCFEKPRVLGEIFRVLKPGGRLQMADIIVEPHVTPEELKHKGSWSD